jgi:hypothetical protein
MRFIEATTGKDVIKRTSNADLALGSYLSLRIEDGISKRHWLDLVWRSCIRQYDGIPEIISKDFAKDSPQFIIEIPVGASMADSITSTVYDLIWNTAPVFSCRGSVGYHNNAAAFQLLADKLLLDDFTNIRAAADDVITDTVQLGTSAYYIVNSKETVKRATVKELNIGPRVFSVPPEDLVVPGGTFPDVDAMPFIAQRMYYDESELREIAAANGWDISQFKKAGNIDWVRQRRLETEKSDQDTTTTGNLYEVFSVHLYYDYDGDGFAEDLFCVWDRTSKAVGIVTFAPYDSRPFAISRYQLRPYVFYGLGVLEMARPFQREVTEWHNFKMQNAHLANSRLWAYRLGAVGIGEEMKISPNKPIGLADPEHDLIEKKMSDMYPSAQQYEAAVIALCEMRVGTPAMGPAAGIQAGKRVPAATAMTALQQQNRRFTGPFDNIRRALAHAMTQCFMRLREEYLKGGQWRASVLEFLIYTVGLKNAELIEAVFKTAKSTDMRDQIIIETTATSQSINRQADKQNAMERIQVMGGYYEKMMGLSQVLMNPQAPQTIKKMAKETAVAATESIRAYLRCFDDVRDPDVFIPASFAQMKPEEEPENGATDQQQAAPDSQDSGGQSGTEAPSGGVSDPTQPAVAPVIEGSSELGKGAADTGIVG